MSLVMDTTSAPRGIGLQSQLVYGALFPFFAASEGVRRRFARDDDPAPRAWLSEVRSNTAIAASYALMAVSMLQSSGRAKRPVRPS